MKKKQKIKFNTFLKFIHKSYEKDIIDALNNVWLLCLEKEERNKKLEILDQQELDGKSTEDLLKYKAPRDFKSLHKFFKKVDKKFKYETIFNVYDDLRKAKSHEFFFELGILSLQIKKKYFFITRYLHITDNIDEVVFDIIEKHKFNKYPDKIKLMKIVHEQLDGDFFPKTTTDKFHRHVDGEQIKGAWGSVVNFSYKLELKPQKTVFHPLYYYSLPHRDKIEKSFLSYPDTKINYEFGKNS
jgi:hypothetical protein|tara:strand:- start:52 stop:777 length:726 start_codon:yes stop_codon:yes gene_type:complete